MGTPVRSRKTVAAALCIAGALSACSSPFSKNPVDGDRLDSALDAHLGGAGTCVVVADASSGEVVYQYGAADVCKAQLPPCATFEAPLAAIGLDAGVVTPATVYRWDGSPQPVGAWQADADIGRAARDQILWWWQDLAQAIGHDRVAEALKRFDYGNRAPDGPARSFWLGPRSGGALTVSTRRQAAFFARLEGGGLGLRPQTTAGIRALLADETRRDPKSGKAAISDVTASCVAAADGSTTVSWTAGWLAARGHDLAFAASVAGVQTPPGVEVRQKVKDSFADAGLWPSD